MREKVESRLSLHHCAKSAGWSPAHFSMVFRRQTKLSPIQFFTRLKMSHACELLKTTDLSMQEIAARIGLNDQFYFSRLFHRHLRMSPTAYRGEFSFER
jgi:transcriptional regulator GlxA family with amidase domain